MKLRRTTGMMRSLWLVVLVGGLCAVPAGCKRRQSSTDGGRRRTAPARPKPPRRDAGVASKAAVWPTLSPSDPARYRRVFKAKRPAGGDTDPVRADKSALGFPVPEGLERVTSRKERGKVSQRFRSPYSLSSLQRFFRREMGKLAKLEKRAFGFKVEDRSRRGFIMVTQPPGYQKPVISVVRPPVTRPRRPDEDLAPH